LNGGAHAAEACARQTAQPRQDRSTCSRNAAAESTEAAPDPPFCRRIRNATPTIAIVAILGLTIGLSFVMLVGHILDRGSLGERRTGGVRGDV
jgi:hypothetical protein